MRAALASQVGELDQVPTAVSAIKVDGKRAYQRVRDGEEVELAARAGDRARARRCTTCGRGASTLDVDVSLRCSSGTYVRAIARDVGAALGVGGHLTALRRTAVGPYDLDRGPHPRASSARPSRCCRSPTPPGRRSRPSTSTRPQAATSASGGALDLDLTG